MAVEEVLNRDFVPSINTGTVGSPTWVEIKARVSLNWSPTKQTTDTTNSDDQGKMSHLVKARGNSITLVGHRQEDPSDGSRDAGQAAVETHGALIGTGSLKQYRIVAPGGEVATFMCSANVTPQGGNEGDRATWQAVLEISGGITFS